MIHQKESVIGALVNSNVTGEVFYALVFYVLSMNMEYVIKLLLKAKPGTRTKLLSVASDVAKENVSAGYMADISVFVIGVMVELNKQGK